MYYYSLETRDYSKDIRSVFFRGEDRTGFYVSGHSLEFAKYIPVGKEQDDIMADWDVVLSTVTTEQDMTQDISIVIAKYWSDPISRAERKQLIMELLSVPSVKVLVWQSRYESMEGFI